MSTPVNLPDELAEQIDQIATDRATFVAEAVRRFLRESAEPDTRDEVARINELADELNREAEDVLEYQVSREARRVVSSSPPVVDRPAQIQSVRSGRPAIGD